MRLTATVVVVLALVTLSSAKIVADGTDSWIGRDKLLHFAAGSVLAGGGYGVSALVLEKRQTRAAAGLAVSLSASAAKEWRDRSHGGTASWRDFAWGSVGAAAGVTIAWIIDRSRHSQDHSRSAPPRSTAVSRLVPHMRR